MTIFKLGKFSFQVYWNSVTRVRNYPTRHCLVLGFDWFPDRSGFGGYKSHRDKGYWWVAVRVWHLGTLLVYERTYK
jgi:hypothetical protein